MAAGGVWHGRDGAHVEARPVLARRVRTRRLAELGGSPRERVVRALVAVMAQRGYAGTPAGLAIERAGVSEDTFDELFPGGVDEVLTVVMDRALMRLGAMASRRFSESATWLEGMRGALAEVLLFFDADRALARVCFLETLQAPAVRAHREHNVRALSALIVARVDSLGIEMPAQAAEVVMAAQAAEVVIAALLRLIQDYLASPTPAERPLIELLGPLMATVVKPFVGGEEAARAELRRGEALVRAIQAGDPGWVVSVGMWETDWADHPPDEDRAGSAASDESGSVPAATPAGPRSRRARECLTYLAAHPGASNSEIAAGIGIAHRSHISRLLTELLRAELVNRHSEGTGRRNAWRLTPRGEEVVAGCEGRKRS